MFGWVCVYVCVYSRVGDKSSERRMLILVILGHSWSAKVNIRQKIVLLFYFRRHLFYCGNIDRISEVQFVLPSNDEKHVHISSPYILEMCGLIFNKIGILFLIS